MIFLGINVYLLATQEPFLIKTFALFIIAWVPENILTINLSLINCHRMRLNFCPLIYFIILIE